MFTLASHIKSRFHENWKAMATAAFAIIISGHSAIAAGDTIEVKLGISINRTWDDVKASNYAYGPKQEFNVETKETHVWLPYGTSGKYFEVTGGKISDPGPNGTRISMIMSVDGYTPSKLTFKLHFDKPIGGFRLGATQAELGLKNAVAGIEYSKDGQTWTTIKQEEKSGIINRFVDPDKSKVAGLKTEDLYIRVYARDKNNPQATRAENVFMKLWLSGDPTWGDAASTFFMRQMQIWVTPSE